MSKLLIKSKRLLCREEYDERIKEFSKQIEKGILLATPDFDIEVIPEVTTTNNIAETKTYELANGDKITAYGNKDGYFEITEECLDKMINSFDNGYQQGRADAIKECKYNVELFREVFLQELERQAIDREEIFMYRNICSMAWTKYLEQLKEQKNE